MRQKGKMLTIALPQPPIKKSSEWVFGGVTADLLSQEEVYLLLSH